MAARAKVVPNEGTKGGGASRIQKSSKLQTLRLKGFAFFKQSQRTRYLFASSLAVMRTWFARICWSGSPKASARRTGRTSCSRLLSGECASGVCRS